MDGGTRVNDLGFDSLMAVEVMDDVESELGVTLSLMDFFEGQSLSDIAEILYDRLFKNNSDDLAMVKPLQWEVPDNATRIADGDETESWEDGDI